MEDRLLLSLREAAKRLGVSERHLWGLTAPRGPVPCVRFGGRVMYRPEDLRDYLARATLRPTADLPASPQAEGRR